MRWGGAGQQEQRSLAAWFGIEVPFSLLLLTYSIRSRIRAIGNSARLFSIILSSLLAFMFRIEQKTFMFVYVRLVQCSYSFSAIFMNVNGRTNGENVNFYDLISR